MGKQTKFILSSKGFANVALAKPEHNFAFLVGDRQFFCNQILADFISPKVAAIHATDPLVQYYRISNENSESTEFYQIMNLLQGQPLEINQNNYPAFQNIGKELGNEEIVNMAFKFNNIKLSNENCVSQLMVKLNFKADAMKEIAFVACHFKELEYKSLIKLSYDALFDVVLNKSFSPSSEEHLFELLLLHKENGDTEFQQLFGYIFFNNIGYELLDQFVKIFKAEDITPEVWDAISYRLLNSNRPSVAVIAEDPSNHPGIICPFIPDSFDGIFQTLAQIHQTNPAENGTVIVTSSSSLFNQPSQLLDPNWNSNWNSANTPNQWVQFDFQGKKLEFEGYSLKTHRGKAGNCHLKNWIVEGSTNGHEWKVLDQKFNDKTLNGPHKVGSWRLDKSDLMRLIRIRSTGPTHRGDSYLCLSSVEFFGSLFD